MSLTCLELCAGGGGTALGLEAAGFTHRLLVDNDPDCCATLRTNRPGWQVWLGDIGGLPFSKLAGRADLLSAGLPCTPHSRGGRQLGEGDERYLWHHACRITGEVLPPAVMLETAGAILSPRFDADRAVTLGHLRALGYQAQWDAVDASQHGVPQRRVRAVLVAFREPGAAAAFVWPSPSTKPPPTVGGTLLPLMAARGWPGAGAWAAGARGLAPTVTGGSKRHGGADLGASQGKAAWRRLGGDPMGLADEAPGPDGKYQRGKGLVFDAGGHGPMLTVPMAALIQGFPVDWAFTGRKTAAYRQVGNAFPPPVARVLGEAIRAALECD